MKLFDGKEIEVENFNKPGSAVIFPSFINHKVTKLIKGKDIPWLYGGMAQSLNKILCHIMFI